MKIDDIVMLIKAGYSKADIESLVSGNQEVTVVTEEQPAEPHDEKPAAVEAQPANDFEDKIKSLETKLDYVVNRFNYMSVKDSTQPAEPAKETIDDILSKMIR